MKRFLSAFLAVFIFLSCFSVSAFAADSGELVCPDCSSSLVDSSVDVGIFVSHHYKCTNCDYERSFMDLFGWNIGQSGSLSDPVYKDGNITYTVPGNGAGRPRYTSIDCDFISPFGFPAWYFKPTVVSTDSRFSSNGTHLLFSGDNFSKQYFTTGNFCEWALPCPLNGTFDLYVDFDYVGPASNPPYLSSSSKISGGLSYVGVYNGSSPSLFKTCSIDNSGGFHGFPSFSYYHASASYFSKDDMLRVCSGSYITNTNYGLFVGYSGSYYIDFSVGIVLQLVGDRYGNPYDFSVKDNDHINTTDNSITVNGNVITYNTAYYDNGVYYIYTDNGVTTYYTDNSGNIYGDVTYQGDTYYITIYNQPEPTPSPSPSPTPDPDNPDNPPTPTSDPDNPNPTPKPTPGGGGSGDSGSSGPSWWDKLVDSIFGAISDFFEGVVKAALKGLWKLLSAILKLPFFIGELFTKLFPFVPGEIATFCVGGFGVLLLIVIIKFIRG